MLIDYPHPFQSRSEKPAHRDQRPPKEKMETAIDEVKFESMPYINRYNWLQREYARMVHKNAQLLSESNFKRKRKARRAPSLATSDE